MTQKTQPEAEVINTESLKSIYARAAGIRNIVLLVGTIVTISIAWADNKSDTAIAKETADTAIAGNVEVKQSVNEIKSDIRVIKDDQEELEEKVDSMAAESMKHTILLERIATKMRLSTETE